MDIKKNKKGMGFFLMLALFSMLLYFSFIIFFINAEDDAIYSNFKLTKDVSTMLTKDDSEKIFFDTYVGNSLEMAKSDFISHLNSQIIRDIDFDSQEYTGCTFEDDIILYNEKNVHFVQADSDAIENEGTDSSSNDVDSSSNDVDSSENLVLTNSCLPTVDDFSSDFLEFVDTLMLQDFDDIETYLGYESFGVNIKEEEGYVSFNVKTVQDSSSTNEGTVTIENTYDYTYNINDYFMIIDMLKENLPQFSKEIKNNILRYRLEIMEEYDGEDIELYIMNIIFKDMMDETGYSDLKKNYDFVITRKDMDSETYYALKFDIKNKKTGDLMFDFVVILENNIPVGLIDYEVEQNEFIDNMIALTITKPESVDPKFYIVLYSYEPFLNEDYGNYNKIISLLDTGNIPNTFDEKLSDFTNNLNYFVSKDNDLDINVIQVVIKNQQNAEDVEVNIFQTYNYVSGQYDRLVSDKELYFAVFGISSTFVYYINPELLSKNFKHMASSYVNGPRPISESELSIEKNLEDVQSSIAFEVEGYEEDVASYKIYLMSGRSSNDEIKLNCDGVEYDCSYYDLVHDSSLDMKYLISFDESFSQTVYDGYTVITKDSFRGSIDYLYFDKEYELFIAPVDSNGGVILNKKPKIGEVKKVSSFMDYYTYEQNDGEYFLPKFKTFLPEDNKKPDPITSINVDGIRQLEDGSFSLSWNNQPDLSVNRVIVSGRVFIGNSEDYDSITNVPLTLEDSVIPLSDYDSEITSIFLDSIIPVDKSNNKFGNDRDTHTASWP